MDWFSWLSKTSLDPPLIYEYGLAFARNELQYEDIAYFNHEFLQSMGISVAKHRLEILKIAKKENGAQPRSLSRLFVAISKTRKSFSRYFSRLVFQDENDVSYSSSSSAARDLGAERGGRYQEHWKGAMLRKQRSGEEVRDDRPGLKNRALALSGPLDSRVHERLMAHNNKSLKLSGPLDGKLHERLMYPNRSPRSNGAHNGRTAPMPERLMIATTRSPRLSGPLDMRGCPDRFLVTSRSPKMSGPLDGRVLNPLEHDYDEHSPWTTLFHDMKPT